MSLDLRHAFGHFATGVTVVTTTAVDGARIGLTVNSFSSLSLEPPLVLWSVGKSSTSYAVFRDARRFAIHVLHVGQEALARRFALRDARRFEGIASSAGLGGVPLLDDYLACFECETHQVLEGGDHSIVVGRVLDYRLRPGEPLLFFRGGFGIAVNREET
jgi:3-hydroxy-9,10-secoandrosta-1,3,5(10)-triene-9,17-dione monooxygenase reductase component